MDTVLYFISTRINDLQLHATPWQTQQRTNHLILFVQVSIHAKTSYGVRSHDRDYPGWGQGGGF